MTREEAIKALTAAIQRNEPVESALRDFADAIAPPPTLADSMRGPIPTYGPTPVFPTPIAEPTASPPLTHEQVFGQQDNAP